MNEKNASDIGKINAAGGDESVVIKFTAVGEFLIVILCNLFNVMLFCRVLFGMVQQVCRRNSAPLCPGGGHDTVWPGMTAFFC